MSKNLKVEHNVEADLEELIKKLDDPNTEQEVKEFYDTVAKFNNFSFHNCWLLHNQAKRRGINISYVTSLKEFNDMGATVKKGSKSLKVFAPKQQYEIKRDAEGRAIKDEKNRYIYVLDENGQKIPSSMGFIQVPVFDRSQTNAIELGLIPNLEYRDNSKNITDEFLNDLYNEVSTKFNVTIQEKNINDESLGGYYQRDKQHITINSKDKTNSSKLTTLFHELAHHLLHGNENYRDMHLDKGMKEGERESVRYIVSRRFGITSKSELYLKSWDRNVDNMQNHLKTIVDTSKKVLKTLDLKSLQEKEMNRKKLTYKYLDNLVEQVTINKPNSSLKYKQPEPKMGIS